MTGGMAVVLGPIGLNFGAGMTGGTAWILDADGSVLAGERYHADFLQAVHFNQRPGRRPGTTPHAFAGACSREREFTPQRQLLADVGLGALRGSST